MLRLEEKVVKAGGEELVSLFFLFSFFFFFLLSFFLSFFSFLSFSFLFFSFLFFSFLFETNKTTNRILMTLISRNILWELFDQDKISLTSPVFN